MSITGVNNNQTTPTAASGNNRNELGKNEFLNLLVAQLQNQDPMNPMDSTGFTAQLAQFSSLEQLQSVNQNLDSLGDVQSGMANSQAVNYIGKTVTAAGNEIQAKGGEANEVNFTLRGDAAAVFVNVYDASGNFIRNIENGAMPAGNQTISWDGLDHDGNAVSTGNYIFEVLATDVNDEKIGVDTYTTGTVSGVTYKGGKPYLISGNLEIPVERVIQVMASQDQQ